MAIPCWKMMPALVTGNTVVLKPSSDTPHCAALLVELMAEAGFPPGTVNLVTGAGAEVGDALVANPDVQRHQLHRQHGDRQAHRRDRGPSAQAAQPRARRQERDRGHGRRRPGPRRRRDRLVGVRDDRPALHGVLAGHRRGGGGRSAARAPRDPGAGAPPRLRPRSGDRRGPAGQRCGAGQGPVVHRCRQARRATWSPAAIGRAARASNTATSSPPTIFSGVKPMDRIAQEEIFGPVLSVIPVPDYAAAVTALNQSRLRAVVGDLHSRRQSGLPGDA